MDDYSSWFLAFEKKSSLEMQNFDEAYEAAR
jgi:hypothetical protein